MIRKSSSAISVSTCSLPISPWDPDWLNPMRVPDKGYCFWYPSVCTGVHIETNGVELYEVHGEAVEKWNFRVPYMTRLELRDRWCESVINKKRTIRPSLSDTDVLFEQKVRNLLRPIHEKDVYSSFKRAGKIKDKFEPEDIEGFMSSINGRAMWGTLQGAANSTIRDAKALVKKGNGFADVLEKIIHNMTAAMQSIKDFVLKPWVLPVFAFIATLIVIKVVTYVVRMFMTTLGLDKMLSKAMKKLVGPEYKGRIDIIIYVLAKIMEFVGPAVTAYHITKCVRASLAEQGYEEEDEDYNDYFVPVDIDNMEDSWSDDSYAGSTQNGKKENSIPVAALLSVFTGIAAIGEIPHAKTLTQVTEFTKSTMAMYSLTQMTKHIATWLYRLCPAVLQSWVVVLLGAPPGTATDDPAISAWFETVMELKASFTMDPDHVFNDESECEKVELLYSTGTDIAYSLQDKGASSVEMREFYECYRMISTMMRQVWVKRGTAPIRQVPVCIYLWGPSQIGKSMMAKNLAADILDKHVDDSATVYTRNSADEFWSGYTKQHAILFDDFGQIRGNREAETLISLISPAIYRPPMASMESDATGMAKGSTVSSKVVILASNVSPATHYDSIAMPAALKNRYHVAVEVMLNGAYLKRGSIDFEKVDRDKTRANKTPHLAFRLMNPHTGRALRDRANQEINYSNPQLTAYCKTLVMQRASEFKASIGAQAPVTTSGGRYLTIRESLTVKKRTELAALIQAGFLATCQSLDMAVKMVTKMSIGQIQSCIDVVPESLIDRGPTWKQSLASASTKIEAAYMNDPRLLATFDMEDPNAAAYTRDIVETTKHQDNGAVQLRAAKSDLGSMLLEKRSLRIHGLVLDQYDDLVLSEMDYSLIMLGSKVNFETNKSTNFVSTNALAKRGVRMSEEETIATRFVETAEEAEDISARLQLEEKEEDLVTFKLEEGFKFRTFSNSTLKKDGSKQMYRGKKKKEPVVVATSTLLASDASRYETTALKVIEDMQAGLLVAEDVTPVIASGSRHSGGDTITLNQRRIYLQATVLRNMSEFKARIRTSVKEYWDKFPPWAKTLMKCLAAAGTIVAVVFAGFKLYNHLFPENIISQSYDFGEVHKKFGPEKQKLINIISTVTKDVNERLGSMTIDELREIAILRLREANIDVTDDLPLSSIIECAGEIPEAAEAMRAQLYSAVRECEPEVRLLIPQEVYDVDSSTPIHVLKTVRADLENALKGLTTHEVTEPLCVLKQSPRLHKMLFFDEVGDLSEFTPWCPLDKACQAGALQSPTDGKKKESASAKRWKSKNQGFLRRLKSSRHYKVKMKMSRMSKRMSSKGRRHAASRLMDVYTVSLTSETSFLHGIPLKGRYIVFPRHFVSTIKTGEVITVGYRGLTYRDRYDPERLTSAYFPKSKQHSEVAVYKVGDHFPMFPDQTARFCRSADIIEGDYKDDVIISNTDCIQLVDNVRIGTTSGVLGGASGRGFMRNYISIPCEDDFYHEGDCGNPTSIKVGGQWKVAGMHVFLLATKIEALSVVVTLEELMAGIDKLEKQYPGYINSAYQGDGVSTYGNFELIDKELPDYDTRNKTAYRVSPLAEGISRVAPAPLNNLDPRIVSSEQPDGEVGHALRLNGVRRFHNENEPYPTDLRQQARKMQLQEYLLAGYDRQPSELTWFEAINGIPGLSCIDMSTSPGEPYSGMGYKTKADLFTWDHDKGGYIANELLQSDLDYAVEQMQRGEIPHVIWKDVLKDELRPLDKVRSAKTRSIVSCSVLGVLLVRKFMGDFNAFRNTMSDRSSSAVGMKPFSRDWEAMIHYLMKVSPEGFDADWKRYDGDVGPEEWVDDCLVCQGWYEAHGCTSTITMQMIEICYYFMTHRFTMCGAIMYILHSGMGSGCPLTATGNTGFNDRRMRMYWCHITPKVAWGLSKQKREVAGKFLGDDSLIASILKMFNALAYAKWHKQFGRIMTSSDKLSPLSSVNKPITRCSFISLTTKITDHVRGSQMRAVPEFRCQDKLFNWVTTSTSISKAENALMRMQAWMWMQAAMSESEYNTELLRVVSLIRSRMPTMQHMATLPTYDALQNAFEKSELGNMWDMAFADDADATGREPCGHYMWKEDDEGFHFNRRQYMAIEKLGSIHGLGDGTFLSVPTENVGGDGLDVDWKSYDCAFDLEEYRQYCMDVEKFGSIHGLGDGTFLPVPTENAGVETTDEGGVKMVTSELPVTGGERFAPVTRGMSDPGFSVDGLVSRWAKIKTVEWLKSMEIGNMTWQAQLPWDLLVRNTIKTPFEKMRMGAFGMELRFEITATRFHCGRMVAYWTPLLDIGSANSLNHANRSAQTYLNHVMIDPTHTVPVNLTIPFVHPKDMLNFARSRIGEENLGVVTMSVFTPLRIQDNPDAECVTNTNSVYITIYARLVDTHFALPVSAPHALPGTIQGAISTKIANVVVKGDNNTVPTEFQGDEYDVVTDVAMDNPALNMPPLNVSRRGVPPFSFCEGTEFMDKLTLHPNQVSVTKKHNFREFPDVMDIKTLVDRPVFCDSFSWKTCIPPGTMLTQGLISPTDCLNQEPGLIGKSMPMIEFISKNFVLWTGSLNYHFDIVASQLHTGTLVFTLHYGLMDPPDHMDDAMAEYSTVLMIDADTHSFDITIPYQADTPQKYIVNGHTGSLEGCTGCWALWIQNPLRCPGAAFPEVDINVYKSGGPDFALSYLGANGAAFVGSIQGIEMGIASGPPTVEYTEQYGSLRDIARRMVRVDTIEGDLNDFEDVLWTAEMLPLVAKVLEPWNRMYSAWRGDVRVRLLYQGDIGLKVYFVPHSRRVTINGKTGPAMLKIINGTNSLPIAVAGAVSSVQYMDVEVPFVIPWNFCTLIQNSEYNNTGTLIVVGSGFKRAEYNVQVYASGGDTFRMGIPITIPTLAWDPDLNVVDAGDPTAQGLKLPGVLIFTYLNKSGITNAYSPAGSNMKTYKGTVHSVFYVDDDNPQIYAHRFEMDTSILSKTDLKGLKLIPSDTKSNVVLTYINSQTLEIHAAYGGVAQYNVLSRANFANPLVSPGTYVLQAIPYGKAHVTSKSAITAARIPFNQVPSDALSDDKDATLIEKVIVRNHASSSYRALQYIADYMLVPPRDDYKGIMFHDPNKNMVVQMSGVQYKDEPNYTIWDNTDPSKPAEVLKTYKEGPPITESIDLRNYRH